MRVWPDGTSEYLGWPTYAPAYADGTRDVLSARIGFAPPGGKPFDLHATILLPVHLMAGTGYGLEQDWRHGMYQGPDLVVQGVSYDLSRPEDAARMWGMVDAVGKFEYEGHTGTGCTSTGRSATIPRSASGTFNIRQLTDVLRCKLQQHFRRKRHRAGR